MCAGHFSVCSTYIGLLSSWCFSFEYIYFSIYFSFALNNLFLSLKFIVLFRPNKNVGPNQHFWNKCKIKYIVFLGKCIDRFRVYSTMNFDVASNTKKAIHPGLNTKNPSCSRAKLE